MANTHHQSPIDGFIQALEDRNWKVLPPERLPIAPSAARPAVRMEVSGASFAGTPVLLQHETHTLLALDTTGGERQPDPDETPHALFKRYLDLSRAERTALWGLCERARCRFLLSVTPEGTRLLDAADETPLGASPPGPDPDQIAHCLRVLDEITASKESPPPDSHRLGHELARWFDLAAGKIGRPLKWARGDVSRFLRHLLLGWKILDRQIRSGPEPDFSRLGMETIRQPGEILFRWQRPEPAGLVETLLSASHEFAPEAAGAFPPLERRALLRQIRKLDAAALEVLDDIPRLSAAKLKASVLLRVLFPTEREHASWRLALVDPLRAAEEIDSSDLYVFKPLRLDLSECGVSRALEAVEKLALHAMGQKTDIEKAGGYQLDMIETTGETRDDGKILDDPFNWLCANALRLRVSDAYRDTIAYLVALRVLELRNDAPFRKTAFAPLTSLASLFQYDREG